MVQTNHVVLRDNDFRRNGGVDCYDATAGSGTSGTADYWANDLGKESSPAGLCALP